MQILLRAICLLLSFYGLSACITPIDFEIDSKDTALVVQGSIHEGPGPYMLRLSRPSKFGNQVFEPVVGAKITLGDDLGLQEAYLELAPGEYQVPGNILTGRIGRSYHIEIQLGENRVYRSTPETMLPVPNVDSVTFDYVVEDQVTELGYFVPAHFAYIYVHTRSSLPNERPAYLKWNIENVWVFYETPKLFGETKSCFITNQIDRQVNILDGSALASNTRIKKFITKKELDNTFAYRQYFNVYQRSLSSEAYKYWQKVELIRNRQGSIFDIPLAPIQGNIFNVEDPEELVLGYFEATQRDTGRVATFASDFPRIFKPFCGPPPLKGYVKPCIDCVVLENSTLQRPAYWFD